MVVLLLLIPFPIYMLLAAFFVWCGYKAFRWGFPTDPEKKPSISRKLTGSVAIGVFAYLLVSLFVPPSYVE